MKNIKGFAAGLVVGIALALSGAGFAQSTSQTQKDTTKAHESCCAMESCCCKGDSCSMNHKGMDHTKQHSKDAAHKDGCCCCGDSCEMKMDHKQDK